MKQIIDLTYPIHKGMFKYPSDAELEVKIIPARIKRKKRVIFDRAYVEEEKYKSGFIEFELMRNHHGTHIDAPAHKLQGKRTIDSYPLKKFINKAKLVNLISKNILKREKKEIRLDDFRDFDFKGDEGALVFYTGFCDLMKTKEGKIKGRGKEQFERAFPYFSEKAAKYLAETCSGLNVVGIDSFSVDPSGSNSEVHRIFFANNVLPLETLVNLAELDSALNKSGNKNFDLICVPMLYGGADASQTRAYAVIKN